MKITKNMIAAPIDLMGKAGTGENSIFNSNFVILMRVHPLSGREFQIFKQITAEDRRANRGVSGQYASFFLEGGI